MALIKLPRPSKFTQVAQPSCLSQSPFEDPLVVVGWGKTKNFQELTSEGVYSNSLRYLIDVDAMLFLILVIHTLGVSSENK